MCPYGHQQQPGSSAILLYTAEQESTIANLSWAISIGEQILATAIRQ